MEQTPDSDPQLALIHPKHTMPSHSPILIAMNWWKEVPGFWLGLVSQLVLYVQAYCVVLDHTSTDSHSSHTIVNAQVSC